MCEWSREDKMRGEERDERGGKREGSAEGNRTAYDAAQCTQFEMEITVSSIHIVSQ